jgi:hypothetical protein
MYRKSFAEQHSLLLGVAVTFARAQWSSQSPSRAPWSSRSGR